MEQSLRRMLDETTSPGVTAAVIAGRACLWAALAEPTPCSAISAASRLCAKVEPAALVKLLNEYFSFIAYIVRGQDGISTGTSEMPLWQDRRNLNEATFRIGIGLATGPAIAGNVVRRIGRTIR